jgi:hypothetical protein
MAPFHREGESGFRPEFESKEDFAHEETRGTPQVIVDREKFQELQGEGKPCALLRFNPVASRLGESRQKGDRCARSVRPGAVSCAGVIALFLARKHTAVRFFGRSSVHQRKCGSGHGIPQRRHRREHYEQPLATAEPPRDVEQFSIALQAIFDGCGQALE